MAKKRRKARIVAKPRGFPTIADLTQSIPGKGLLDPCLRKGVTGKVPTTRDVFGE